VLCVHNEDRPCAWQREECECTALKEQLHGLLSSSEQLRAHNTRLMATVRQLEQVGLALVRQWCIE
jgi:hypothetical protein